MAREYYIDGRIGVNGLKGHLGMGNPVKLSEAINRTLPNIPTLSANPYTFENGLNYTTTTSGTLVKLGGELTEDTVIDGVTSMDFKVDQVNIFSASGVNCSVLATTAVNIRTKDSVTTEDIILKVETDSFSISSTDTLNNTVIYELPTNDQPSEGDIMVINNNNKAVFVSYERDVQVEEIPSITTGHIANFYVPFNEGNWYLKRVTFWSFGVTTGDSFKFVIKNSAGTIIAAEKTIVMNEANPIGAGGAGIGFTEGSNFTHIGAPDAYFLEITDDNMIIPHNPTRVTLSFIKVF